ncbi:MAG TPA: hypothetical protein VHV55_15890 [Pirellulales bacterium]|jgi:hypothetical protein|nr:hypothetical protein [Pirellulales bacterium]
MDEQKVDRRHFSKFTLAAFGGLLAGAQTGLAADDDDKPLKNPLLGDPHICRGINTCKGKGKSKDNACAGQGTCATAKAHSCHAANDCRGQGGCGAKPGENTCKAMGACAVPLQSPAWKKARKRFEELMTKAGKSFGDAPPAKEE